MKSETPLLRTLRCCSLCLITTLGTAWGAPPSGGGGANPQASSPQGNTPATTPSQSGGGGSSGAIESQLLAYGAVDQLSRGLLDRTCTTTQSSKSSGKTIVLLDPSNASLLGSFHAFLVSVQSLRAYYILKANDKPYATKLDNDIRERLKSLTGQDLPPPELPTPTPAPAQPPRPVPHPAAAAAGGATLPLVPTYLSTFLPILAASSTSSNPQSITISNTSLYASLMRENKNNAENLKAGSGSPPCKFDLKYPFIGLNASDVDSTNLTIITTDLGLMEKNAGLPSSALNAPVDNIDATYATLLTTLATIDSSSGLSGLDKVTTGAALDRIFGDKDPATKENKETYVLLASVASAGGTQRDRKSLWTELGSGDKIDFSGGVIVQYFLLKSNYTSNTGPEYVDSGILRIGVGFDNFEDYQKQNNIGPKGATQ